MPRPEEFFPSVRDNFPRYESFFQTVKPFPHSEVELQLSSCQKKSTLNPRLALAIGGFDFSLHAELILKGYKYAYKIFCSDFGSAPFFRFDSTGRAHFNEENGGGLTNRAVPTPHYHKVDNDGIMRAYQSDDLKNHADDIISDLEKGGNMFLNEANITSDESVIFRAERPELFVTSPDPLNGVTFN